MCLKEVALFLEFVISRVLNVTKSNTTSNKKTKKFLIHFFMLKKEYAYNVLSYFFKFFEKRE